ncbi:helix-turn-helix domain-containing protein [Clostridium sp.]|uniref:helix-turn-helix domain-containing protein n=1 Tax=Clostridium sp. TaxID=1506 RepID=UPI0035227FB2
MLKDKIKEIRIKKGITIQELSHLTKLSLASLSMYETGKRVPSIKNIGKIAEALNISVDELFNDDNDKERDEFIIKSKMVNLSKEEAIIRADGKCELCGNNAPFITNEGEPYLLVKSIYYDEVDESYMFALCPNCLARLTVLNFYGDKKYLLNRYNRRKNEKGNNYIND